MTGLRQLLLGAGLVEKQWLLSPVTAIALLLSAASFQTVSAATAPSLGTTTFFAVLGGSTVTNTGPTVINGDLGVSPGSVVPGFPPGIVVPPGTVHAADAVAAGAQRDNTIAYNALAAQVCNFNLTGQDLGGLTLIPGVYCFSSSAQLTGTLTLNAQGNANAVFIFQIGGTLTTASNSSVNIINGGSACNVFWQVGSSAILGTTTSFIGNILALTNITLNTGARVSGRALAQNGAVTLDSNVVSITDCNASFIAPPIIIKAFGAAAIGVFGTTTLSFTINNPNGVPLTGVAFTDTLPAGLVVSTPNGLTGTCDAGIITAVAGSGSVSLTGATLAAGASCTFSINVTGTTLGVKNNGVTVTSTNGGTGNTSMTSVTVLATSPIPAPPTITKAFGAAVIGVGGTTTLRFTINNPNGVPLTGVAFTDTLPAGLVVSTPNGLTGTCDAGIITAVAGSGSVSLAGATLAGGASCTFSVNVTGTTEGVKNNSVTVTSQNGGTGNTSTTSVLAVAAPPAISKSFGTEVIPLGGTTALSFTIINPNATVALTGVGFVDTLPAGLVVATPNGLTGSCGGGVITAPAGSGSISLSGATLAAGASCTFSVNVTATSLGVLTNITGNVTSANGGLGNTASATIAVGVYSLTATAGTPQSAMTGTAFGTPLQATVRDASNVPLPDVTVTFTAPISGASGTFAGGVTTVKASANAAGVATAPAFTANGTPGAYVVTASVSGIGTPASFSLVNIGPPASIAPTAGTPQSAPAGTAFATALQATVRDAANNLLSGVTVTFTAPPSGASGTFAGDGTTVMALTNAAGVATAPTFTANGILASYTVNATVAGVMNPATFNLTNTPGPTALVTAVSGGGQSAAINTAFANPFVVNVKDAFGNLVPGASVTFVAPSSGPSGKFKTTSTITATVTTDASGIATSPMFTANGIAGGPYNVAASSTGNSSTAFFALTNNNPIIATTTALTSSPNPSNLGQLVTLTATVAPAGVTGKVTFSFGTMLIGTATLNGSGQATLTTRLLPSGTAPLRATYTGDSTHASSTSSPVSQTVKALAATSFAPLVNFGAGTGPYAMALGDFNGDGIADLAIANQGSSNLTVLLGNGSGGFVPAPGSPIALGNFPGSVSQGSVAVGDFNGDGNADLIVSNRSGANVIVLMGDGSGGFTQAAPVAALAPGSLAVADFNGDGLADFAVVNIVSPANTITVFLGNGNGGFTAAPGSPSPAADLNALSLVAGDFNGDGRADLAVANNTGNTVTVLLGNGNGGFAAAPGSPIAAGVNPESLAVGDFNGDGFADLAVVNGGSITVLLGSAASGFTQPAGSPFTVPGASGNNSVAVGDFNGDGMPDIAVTGTSGQVVVMLGNGSGGFTPSVSNPFPVGALPLGIVAGDFNGDSKTDLAVANFTSNNVSVLLGIGPPASVTATAGTPQTASAGTAFATALQATVRDASNNLLSGATVTFTASASGPSGTFAGDGNTATATTNASGVATAPAFTANCAVGPYTVTATVTGVATAANYNLTNTLGLPASIAATSGSGQSAFVNTAFANPLLATVRDSCSNPVPNASVTFTAPATGAGAKFATTGTNSATVSTDASGVAISPALTANATPGGPYVVTAAAPSVASPANFSLTNSPLPVLSTTPTALSFSYQIGASVPAAQPLAVASSGGTVSFTAAASPAGGTWLSVSPASASTPASLSVSVDPAGLAAGSYNKTITITSAGASNSPLTVGVTLMVTPQPVLSTTPTMLSFSYQMGASLPAAQPLAVASSSVPLSFTAAASVQTPAGGTWLSVSPLSGSTPASLSVSVDPTGLPAGTYGGTITITGAGALNSPLTLAVTLTVTPQPVLSTTPTMLSFSYQVGASPPAAQPLAVASSSVPLSFTAAASVQTPAGGTWLSVSPLSGSTPASLSVSVDPTGLAAGTYNGMIAITGAGASNSPLTVTVTLMVSQQATLSTTPTTLSFSYQIGTSPPAAQPLAVASSSGPLSFTAAASVQTPAGGTWLSVSPLSGSTPANLSVSVDPAGLAPGTYNGTITIAGAGASNSPLTVTVTLMVSQQATLSTTPPTLSFSYQIGTSPPAAQLLAVASSSALLSFTATATVQTPAGGTWLSVIPASGSTPASLSVSVDPTGLAAGTYNGMIAITGAGASNSPLTVPVTLTVTPQPVLSTTPTILSFSYQIGADTPAAQLLAVASSSALLSFTATATVQTPAGGTWLSVIPASGSTPANLSVSVNPIGLAAGTYAGTILIASGAVNTAFSNTPLMIPVTLTVNSPRLQLSGVCPAPPVPQGVLFTLALAATGGNGNYRLTSSGPPWLTLSNSSGTAMNGTFQTALTGVPPAGGSFPFTVTLSDTGGSAPVSLSCGNFAVLPQLVIVGACPVAQGTINQPYSLPLTAAGGVAPYNWALTVGSLPAGVTLSATSGVISGTPTASGTFPFTVQVTDASAQHATFSCSIVIVSALTITNTCPVAQGTINQPYSLPLVAAGGVAPYSWALTTGTLPAGLALNPTTGVISGTPTATGTFPFTVRVTDTSEQRATFSCNLVIVPALGVTSTCPVAQGSVNLPYTLTLAASGGVTPYTWALITGSLPAGLVLNPTTGVISGTPTANGTFPFTVQVTDAAGSLYSAQHATFSCSLVIIPALTITSLCPLAQATINQPYTLPLIASGGIGPYTWNLVPAGSLPAGLSLNPTTGFISGNPTTLGNYPFSVQATDSAPPPLQQTRTFTCGISVRTPPLKITSACPASPAPQGVRYSQFLTATGGSSSFIWAIVVGSLPAGLNLAGNQIFGTPTGPPGTTRYSISVTSGEDSAEIACSLVVTPPILQITSGCPADGVQGNPYGPFLLTASAGITAPAGFVFLIISGALPAGLTLNGNAITGTPLGPPGQAVFGIQVANGADITSAGPCTMTIAAPVLTVGGVCPTSAQVGVPLSIPVPVSGGTPPYVFSFSGDSWLNFAGGAVTGTPPSMGTASFNLSVTDSGRSTAKTFSCRFPVTVATLVINATCPASPVTVNTPFSLTLSASGGRGPYSWALSGPPWLSLSSPAGTSVTLAGTPPATGSFPFSVTLIDSAGSPSATFNCTLIVNPVAVPPLVITPGAACPASPLDFRSAVSLSFAGSGGAPPYTWTLTGPSFLSLSATTGTTTTVAGVASSPGSFPFSITLSDSANTQPATFSCTLAVNPAVIPAVTVTGLGTPTNLFTPISGTVTLASPSPVVLTGRVRLTFTPSATNPIDNPQVHFSDPCLRDCAFTLPVGSTTFPLPSVELGTVAGTIHIEIVDLHDGDRDVLPSIHPSGDIVIPRSKPVITSIAFENETATGFDIVVSGYSTPRDMTSVSVAIAARTGTTLQGVTQFSYDVANLFNGFYQSARSAASGSMFTGLRMTVSVSGAKDAIGSVTVTLSNSVGQSDPVSKAR
jgi:uncharacterized repeat protein (TIGR01451 family)